MSLMGKEFDEAMREIKQAAMAARITLSNLNEVVLKLETIITKIEIALK
jgi:hypothetical protein